MSSRAGVPIRVLVADDDENTRDVLARLFGSAAGFEVVGAAHDLPSTVDLVRRHAPDAVLLDQVMPGMTGATAVTELRQAGPATAIVVISGYGQDDPESRAIGDASDGFVEKGAPRRVLLRTVTHAVTGRGAAPVEDTDAALAAPASKLPDRPSFAAIADALHDGPVQTLSGCLWLLDVLEDAGPDGRPDLIATLREAMRRSLTSTRQIMLWARDEVEDADPAR